MHTLILDHELQQVSLLSSFVSRHWDRQFLNIGSFEIAVNLNTRNAEELQEGRIVYCDEDRCGIIERVEVTRETDMSGEVLVASGIQIKDTSHRRITIPPVGKEYLDYVAMSRELIARDLLDKCLINPIDVSRRVPIFELGAINGVGSSIDFSTRYKSLGAEIINVLQDDALGLVCRTDLKYKKVYFEIRQGLDRTIDQDVNPSAVFSLSLGTASQSVVLHDAQTYKNVAFVGGQGKGIDRNVITISKGNTTSGLNRREVFIDARDAVTADELTVRGMAKLMELGQVYHVQNVANNSERLEYSLGDTVTVMDYRTGIYENVQITAIQETEAGTETMQKSLTFGRAPISLGQAVNSKLSGINNILTE